MTDLIMTEAFISILHMVKPEVWPSPFPNAEIVEAKSYEFAEIANQEGLLSAGAGTALDLVTRAGPDLDLVVNTHPGHESHTDMIVIDHSDCASMLFSFVTCMGLLWLCIRQCQRRSANMPSRQVVLPTAPLLFSTDGECKRTDKNNAECFV